MKPCHRFEEEEYRVEALMAGFYVAGGGDSNGVPYCVECGETEDAHRARGWRCRDN